MSATVTLNEGTVEGGYLDNQLKTLIGRSQKQYDKQVPDHGPDKNWFRDEARWHIWKACDELFQARNHVHNAEYDAALPNFGDGLNHMLFAMVICYTVWAEETETSCDR